MISSHMHKCEPYARDQILRYQCAQSDVFALSIRHSRTKSQEAMGDHGGSSPSSGTKRFFHDSMTSVKSSKRNSGSSNKQGTRQITMGNWHGDNGGCYLRVDINGTSFPVNQACPLLGPNRRTTWTCAPLETSGTTTRDGAVSTRCMSCARSQRNMPATLLTLLSPAAPT
jgi:hypothetical protein